jgi:Domain of unknown function (DUF4424)
MMQGLRAAFLMAIVGATISPGSTFAQSADGGPDAAADPHAPALAPLAVGSLQMASNADLVIEKIDVAVTVDQVVVSYALRNKGAGDLSLAASIAMPGMQKAADSGEIWRLPAATPENPVGLRIAVNGAPVAAQIEVKAYALGIDRQAEIKAAHLPLLPFAPEMDKAIAGLSPQSLAELASLGIVSPRDPEQPDHKIGPDWTIEAIHSWRQALPAGKTTILTARYTPLKAEARYGKADALDLEDLKDEACLTPQAIAAAQRQLRTASSALKAIEIALVNDPPIRWFDSPTPTVSVQKPAPDAIVGFCGIDSKSADQPIVRGSEIGGQDPRDFRILIFEPITK